MKHYLLLCLFGYTCAVFAQFYDDFSFCNLDTGSSWQGMYTSFDCSKGELRSAHVVPNTQFYLSRSLSGRASDLEWSFHIRLGFNPSSLNYVDMVLYADSFNLMQARNGCFVRFGGSSDEISVFGVNGGTEKKLLDGKDGVLNSSGSQFDVKIVHQNDSLSLHYRPDSTHAFIYAGSTFMALPDSIRGFCGIRIKQSTSTFFGKHVLDGLYAGPILKDTTAPRCDSLILLSADKVVAYFNEPCDSSFLNAVHYVFSDVSKVDSILPGCGGTCATLYLHESIHVNQYVQISVGGISDLHGNVSKTKMFRHIWYKADSPLFRDLLITELMVDPEPSAGLPVQEYIEIQNVSGRFIQLGGCSVSDPLNSIELPNVVLHPDTIVVLYQVPSLNNSSDHIVLRNPQGALLHELAYSDAMYGNDFKKAGGYSLEMVDLNEACRITENWKASTASEGGTPGKPNSVKSTLPADIVAPALTTFKTDKDSLIYLYFNEDVLVTPALEFSLNGRKFVPMSINIDTSANSCKLVLPFITAPDTMYDFQFSGFTDCVGNVQTEVSVSAQWPSTSSPGDICFSELLFNPFPGGKDFVELYNNSAKAINLADVFIATNDAEGNPIAMYPLSSDYTLLYPGNYVLLSEDTASICKSYTCGLNGIKLQMKTMPAMPDQSGHLCLYNLQADVLECCNYHEDMHVAMLTDQNGISLERVSFRAGATERSNWHSAASVAGFATPLSLNSQSVNQTTKSGYFNLVSGTFSPDQDGFEDVMILSYRLPSEGYIGRATVFALSGRPVKSICSNCLLGTEGVLSWDGSSDTGEMTQAGVYVLLLECSHPGGIKIREKLVVVLACRF